EHFSWVDYVQRVTDPAVIAVLNGKLLEDLESETPQSYLAPPEPLDWEKIHAFGYSRSRKRRDLDMSLAHYLEKVEKDSLTIDVLQQHRVSAYGDDEEPPADSWPVYKCLVFETSHSGARFVLTAGDWFEIDRDFATGVNRILRRVPIADVPLPTVRRKPDGRLESEPAYNRRAAEEDPSIALLDTRTARGR